MAWTETHTSSRNGLSAISLSEVVVNDTSKDLVFDTDIKVGAYLEITQIRIELTTTATVGNRLMVVELYTAAAADLIYDVILAQTSLAASLSRTWQLSVDADTAITTPQFIRLPENFNLHATQVLRIRDTAAVDAAADDMVVHVNGILHY